MAIKGKEVISTVEIKKVQGYIQTNFNPTQWKDIRSKKIKPEDIKSNQEKVYQEKSGEPRLDLSVQIGKESRTIKVVGEENVQEFLDLFDSVDRVYGTITYEQTYMKGRKYIDLELENYDKAQTIGKRLQGESALEDMM